MKKLLYAIVVASLGTLFALNANAQKHYIGLRIGANLANESDDSLPSGVSNSILPGLLAGIQVERVFNDQWSVSDAILYDQKGAHQTINRSETELGAPFSETGTYDFNLQYIEDQIAIKMHFGNGPLRPYVFAGPSIGFYLSGKEKANATLTFLGQTGSVDTTMSIPDSDVKSFEFSIVAGAGVDLKLDGGQIVFLDASYAFGLTDVVESYGGWIHSRDIRLTTGILFPLD